MTKKGLSTLFLPLDLFGSFFIGKNSVELSKTYYKARHPENGKKKKKIKQKNHQKKFF
jgi:hypothetical protein